MTWQYHQSSGRISRDGRPAGIGYSGIGNGRNNPTLEMERNVGPIPRGRYKIGASYAHAEKGPVAMRLTPVDHLAHGRTDFLIHGDSVAHPGSASHGCIVLARPLRQAIADSGDHDLEVVQ